MKKISIMALTGIMALSLMVGCTSNGDKTQEDTSTNYNMGNGIADSSMYPEMVIYKGTNYLMSRDESVIITQDMVGEKIGGASAFIDFKGTFDESLLTKELANSINENAVFYKMKIYNEDFRILAETNGKYYICENARISVDNILGYKAFVQKATINNNSMTKEYKKLGKEDTLRLIDIFAKTNKAELTNAEYETIGQAQAEGKSYQLSVFFEDGTSTKFNVIPELNLVSIGQEYYKLDLLKSEVAFVFDGVPEEMGEIIN